MKLFLRSLLLWTITLGAFVIPFGHNVIQQQRAAEMETLEKELSQLLLEPGPGGSGPGPGVRKETSMGETRP